MKLRIKLARFFLRFGKFIQSLPVVVMKPDDIVEFSRQTYEGWVKYWSKDDLVDSGLNQDELDLLQHLPIKEGHLLLLGLGGGREAIPLLKTGFQVTGVDFVSELVEKAKENVNTRGFELDVLVQDFSRLNVEAGFYDVVWLSNSMYSCIPTRKRRIEMLRRVKNALKPGGYFLCQFFLDSSIASSKKGVFLRRLIAFFSFGNREYEAGDFLWQNIEFLHAFSNVDIVRSELEESGFQVMHISKGKELHNGVALCQ